MKTRYTIAIDDIQINVTKEEFEYQLNEARNNKHYHSFKTDNKSFFRYENNKIVGIIHFMEFKGE